MLAQDALSAFHKQQVGSPAFQKHGSNPMFFYAAANAEFAADFKHGCTDFAHYSYALCWPQIQQNPPPITKIFAS
jgi:hypothetical protein